MRSDHKPILHAIQVVNYSVDKRKRVFCFEASWALDDEEACIFNQLGRSTKVPLIVGLKSKLNYLIVVLN